MNVTQLIEILKTHDPLAVVEIETSNDARKADPLTRIEAWRFFGQRSVVLRTDERTRSSWGKNKDIVDMEPVQPKLNAGES